MESTRFTPVMLAFGDAASAGVSLIALAVVFFSMPSVSRGEAEFYPTNVDEADLNVSVNGPEGTKPGGNNEGDAGD